MARCISDARLAKFDENIRLRTRYITVVLEDIFQPQNASAVLRSADGFGIQDIHIIETRNTYRVNPDVALGASQWLSLHKYRGHDNNTKTCIAALREQGYRIVATTPHTDDCYIHELDLTKGKVALLFGTEIDGLSKDAIAEADEFVRIPMSGFTESYNISVSAAICMYELSKRLHASGISWQLNAEEMLKVRLDWVRSCLQRPDLVEAEFFRLEEEKKNQ
ncbi:MAG: tRNA (guanosine-2'-O-)-methyltransferase [Bacteroidetes bacterium]|nr:MAG: tRNA (guanosine-2'-O-)-methyltransferase [Bacteroidota bacterium]